MSTTTDDVLRRLQTLAAAMAAGRDDRRMRTALDPADFTALADAGFLLTGVPVEMGGLWESPARSARNYCSLIRRLAFADPSLALVASMHPAVLAFWLTVEQVGDDEAAWQAQRRELFDSALAGHWWGTVISEPGSGGDPMRTRTVAARRSGAGADRNGAAWRLTGEKHFGSGSGVTSFMITTARPEAEDHPDLFIIDMRGRPWDASAGLELRRAWDGHGMMATQSHAFTLDACPATRAASPEGFVRAGPFVAQLTPLMFTAVVIGILDAAMHAAVPMMSGKWRGMRAYEQVTFTDASNRIWLAQQAYEGALRAVEAGEGGALAAARCKLVAAELAESALTLLARVIGGGSFSKSLPFGQWSMDVRALGFLRPPWGFAHDQLMAMQFDQ